MIELLIMILLLFALIAAGVPVHISLGVSSLAYFFADGLPLLPAVHTMIEGINGFTLIAIPFFIFAGHLMNAAKVTDRIFEFARIMVGAAPGGLAQVNIASSVVFAGMSGAAVADAGGLGAVEIKAMKEAGYHKGFAVGVTAASSTIGPIIPPSLPLIVYGVIAEVSIGQLFIAGLVPGLLMAIALSVMVYWYAKHRNYPTDRPFNWQALTEAGKRSFFALLTPPIIVGGILTGIFTPTEAAIAAVAYIIFIGMLVYKSMSWADVLQAALQTLTTTAAVLLIVASAALFAWVLAANQVAEGLTAGLLSMTDNPIFILLAIMLIVFIVGFFVETIAAITILVPLLMPVALAVGIDPVQLGILMVLNLMIGLLTPPVGMVLFVLAKVSDTPIEECIRSTLPFLIPLLSVLILLVLFPSLSLWLPGLTH